MNSRFLIALTIFCVGFFGLSACNSVSQNKEATTSDAQTLSNQSQLGNAVAIDTAASKVYWRGAKLIGDSHKGYVPVLNGQVFVSNGRLNGGNIVLDMRSLQPTDQDLEGNNKLKAHLSSTDFFSVDSFPTASFEINKIVDGTPNSVSTTPDSGMDAKKAGIVSNATVTGNMTIKGTTMSITFPAEIDVDSNSVMFKAAFAIDRTLWGVNYGSENSIRDKIISKNVDFDIIVKSSR